MAMKETVGSLRAYLILVGVLSLLLDALPLIQTEVPLFTILGAVRAILGLACVIIGVQIEKMLTASMGLVKAVILGNVVFVIVLYGLMTQYLTPEQMGAQIWRVLFSVAIGAYLLVNATRLSKELTAAKAGNDVAQTPQTPSAPGV